MKIPSSAAKELLVPGSPALSAAGFFVVGDERLEATRGVAWQTT
jgi:hypothetical protein